jgi:predicted transcriptional regulator
MSNPQIVGNRRTLSASTILEALGDRLMHIKMEDRLRWSDMGEALGVSEDQVAKYADGTAAMNVVTYAKAWAHWRSRFTGDLELLVEGSTEKPCATQTQSRILKACLAIEEAKVDGDLTVEDIRSNRTVLEHARDAIDAQLARLGPKGATA